jgi:hypothetical protein
MATASLPLASERPVAWTRVLAAGSLVAVLDISYAGILYIVILGRTTVLRLFQGIAAGLLGRDSFAGGLPTAALGAALHFTIACTWTVVYLVALRSLPELRRLVRTTSGAATAGVVYGALVWCAMDLIVLPLAGLRSQPPTAGLFWLNIVQHALMVGSPIVFLVRPGAPEDIA